jgi:epoxyqueuosine reductase
MKHSPHESIHDDAFAALEAAFRDEGLAVMGTTDAAPSPEREAAYRGLLASGFHGSMTYLEHHAPMKYAPRRLLTGCGSIVFTGLGYFSEPGRAAAEDEGIVARYAWGRDYHKTLGKRLLRVRRTLEREFPRFEWRSFVDAVPIDERYFANRAGVGRIGRNTMLIGPGLGSWFVIGEILTTAVLRPSAGPASGHGPVGDGTPTGTCPPGCFRCIAACPTGALRAPYTLDASRCISYLTIEHRGPVPAELRPKLGRRLFGCDACQEACPENRRPTPTGERDFLSPIAGPYLSIEELLSMKSDEEFTRRFAGSPLVRTGLSKLAGTACIVAANAGADRLTRLVRSWTGSEDPAAAEHARWALESLGG